MWLSVPLRRPQSLCELPRMGDVVLQWRSIPRAAMFLARSRGALSLGSGMFSWRRRVAAATAQTLLSVVIAMSSRARLLVHASERAPQSRDLALGTTLDRE